MRHDGYPTAITEAHKPSNFLNKVSCNARHDSSFVPKVRFAFNFRAAFQKGKLFPSVLPRWCLKSKAWFRPTSRSVVALWQSIAISWQQSFLFNAQIFSIIVTMLMKTSRDVGRLPSTILTVESCSRSEQKKDNFWSDLQASGSESQWIKIEFTILFSTIEKGVFCATLPASKYAQKLFHFCTPLRGAFRERYYNCNHVWNVIQNQAPSRTRPWRQCGEVKSSQRANARAPGAACGQSFSLRPSCVHNLLLHCSKRHPNCRRLSKAHWRSLICR